MSFILLGILNSQVDAGGAGAYDLLETQVLTSSASSVTFTGLGAYSDYKHLQLRAVVRSDRASSVADFLVNLNADTGANYAFHTLGGNGTSVFSSAATSQSLMETGFATGSTFTANAFGVIVMDILDFSSTTKNTTLRSLTGLAGTENNQIRLVSGLYNSTSAVTSLEFTSQASTNFITGSRFSLYGVK
jgi:hypothetical protein